MLFLAGLSLLTFDLPIPGYLYSLLELGKFSLTIFFKLFTFSRVLNFQICSIYTLSPKDQQLFLVLTFFFCPQLYILKHPVFEIINFFLIFD